MIETSESGAPIHRHEQPLTSMEYTMSDPDHMERIVEHIKTYIGPVDKVFHELIPSVVHVDIHVVAPTPQRNMYTLVTSGMSDLPMKTPEGHEEYAYAELMLCLPPDWPMTQESWDKEENYFPIRMLKFLARFPHLYQTWLWLMHTIPNGNPPAPFAANTKMSGVILLPPVTVPIEFHELVIDSEKTIHFFSIVPLHADEMDLKLKLGAEALFDGFERDGVTEILQAKRPSVLAPKKSWYQFWR